MAKANKTEKAHRTPSSPLPAYHQSLPSRFRSFSLPLEASGWLKILRFAAPGHVIASFRPCHLRNCPHRTATQQLWHEIHPSLPLLSPEPPFAIPEPLCLLKPPIAGKSLTSLLQVMSSPFPPLVVFKTAHKKEVSLLRLCCFEIRLVDTTVGLQVEILQHANTYFFKRGISFLEDNIEYKNITS